MSELQAAYWSKANGALVALAKEMAELSKAMNEQAWSDGDVDMIICQTVNIEQMAERLRRITVAYSALPCVREIAKEYFAKYPEGR